MPYRREQFINEEIYHIVIRGIDNNLLFKNIDDYYRGIFSIYEFNNANSVEIIKRRQEIQTAKKMFRNQIKKVGGDPFSSGFKDFRGFRGERVSPNLPDNRDLLVEILLFCLMPNHIHLLLRQLKDNGITQFMRKLGAGYGGYFNRKYNRKGYVFQNRFVSVRTKTDNQLKIVFVYFHTNPISLIEPKWKEIGIKNPNKVIKFLENNYRWSSYFDYIGKKNFPSVTERDFMLKVMGGEQGCKEFIENWVRYKGEIREFPEIALE
jgi:putative transposase